MADRTTLTFTESDEVNIPTATYIYSQSQSSPDGKDTENTGRLDVMFTRFSLHASIDIDSILSIFPRLLHNGLQHPWSTA